MGVGCHCLGFIVPNTRPCSCWAHHTPSPCSSDSCLCYHHQILREALSILLLHCPQLVGSWVHVWYQMPKVWLCRQHCCLSICCYFGWLLQLLNLTPAGLSTIVYCSISSSSFNIQSCVGQGNVLDRQTPTTPTRWHFYLCWVTSNWNTFTLLSEYVMNEEYYQHEKNMLTSLHEWSLI